MYIDNVMSHEKLPPHFLRGLDMTKVKLGTGRGLHLQLQSVDSTLEPAVMMFGTALIPLVLQIPIHRTLSVQANNVH